MSGEAIELPIFELGIVLVPGESVPLHIFEPRYRRMTAHCLEAQVPFGILHREGEDGPAASVGCTARITQVLERFEDGRTNILVEGEQPFRVLEALEPEEFPQARVEMLDDEDTAGDAEEALEAFAELAEHATDERPSDEELAELDSYAIAARVELPTEFKQELLELRSEPARLELLAEALRKFDRRLRAAKRIQERASGNGQVSSGG